MKTSQELFEELRKRSCLKAELRFLMIPLGRPGSADGGCMTVGAVGYAYTLEFIVTTRRNWRLYYQQELDVNLFEHRGTETQVLGGCWLKAEDFAKTFEQLYPVSVSVFFNVNPTPVDRQQAYANAQGMA